MSDNKGLIEYFGQALVENKAPGVLKGGLASGVAIALLSVTHAVPNEWELWVQWPLFGLFVIGLLRLAWAIR